jgi:hypothetical protein
VLGVDGQLAGGDTKVVLRLGDPESEGISRGALALPSEGSPAEASDLAARRAAARAASA